MKDYDEFEEGDRVWSSIYGFGEVLTDSEDNTFVRHSNSETVNINCDGTAWGFEHRPRLYYYAIADTDQDMQMAIAHGKGLRRPGKPKDWDSMLGEYACSEFEKLLVAVLKKTVDWKNMEYILIEHVIKRVNQYASACEECYCRPFGADYSTLYPSVAALHKITEQAVSRFIQASNRGDVK